MKEVYDTVHKELEQIEEEKLRRNITRSRAQWIEEGEKCSKYFMQLETKNYKTKCMTTLIKDESKIADQQTILKECKEFHKALYSEPVLERNFENCKFLKQNIKS